MKAKLPNLELLEYQAKQTYTKEEFQKKLKEYKMNLFGIKREPKYVIPDLKCEVFPQMWGSTCTAFDVDNEGNAMWGGCAMTEAYTTVFYESITNTYVVFVDNKMCYMIDNPSEIFLKDLNERMLKPLSEAKKLY